MSHTLPDDIVAIDCGDRSYMFYVNADSKLSYLLSPGAKGTGGFTSEVVEIKKRDVFVNKNTRQVAAITWDDTSGTKQIRVYYVNVEGNLSEVCHNSNQPGVWYQGSLGEKGSQLHEIAEGSSISATVHKYPTMWSLRVFASGKGQKNKYGNPNISVYMFDYDEAGANDNSWAGHPITNEVETW